MKRDRAFNRDERGNIIYNDAAAAEMHTPFANATLRFYKLKQEFERLIKLRNRYEQTRPEADDLDWGDESEYLGRREIRRVQNSLDQGALDQALLSSDDSDEDPNIENSLSSLQEVNNLLKRRYEPHFQEAQELLREDFKQELYEMGDAEEREARQEQQQEREQRNAALRRRMERNFQRRNIIHRPHEIDDIDLNSYEDDQPPEDRQDILLAVENDDIWAGNNMNERPMHF